MHKKLKRSIYSLFPILLINICLVTNYAYAQVNVAARKYYEKGFELIEGTDYSKCRKYFEDAAQIYLKNQMEPKYVNCMSALAYSFDRQGSDKIAISIIEKVKLLAADKLNNLNNNPELEYLRFLLVEETILINHGEFLKALALIDTLSRHVSRRTDLKDFRHKIFLNYGGLLISLQRYEESIMRSKMIIDDTLGCTKFHENAANTNIALAFLYMGDALRAEYYFLEILKSSEERVTNFALNNLGFLYLESEKAYNALPFFKESLQNLASGSRSLMI